MQKIQECRSMNFSIYEGMLNRYKDSEDIRKSYESRGLNGLEVIRAGEPDEGPPPPAPEKKMIDSAGYGEWGTSVFSFFLDGLVEGEL